VRFNVYALVQGDAGVQALLGNDPMRFWPFGEADEQPAGSELREVYATWQTVAGRSENYLSGRSDMDWSRVQIDVWGPTGAAVDAVVDALRNALELRGYLGGINLDGRDPETRLYRISFDFEFWQAR
jgi:hypothetical protein